MSGLTAFFVGFFGLNVAMGTAALLSRFLSWGFGIAVGVVFGLAIVVRPSPRLVRLLTATPHFFFSSSLTAASIC
jgi:short subunit fatty acids transporter